MRTIDDRSRRLLWHGVLLFLLSLLIGAFVSVYANPSMGVSAHVGGLMTGLFLGAVAVLAVCALLLWGLRRARDD